MSSHAETVQHAQEARTACETTLAHVHAAATSFDEVEQHLRAAFDGTGHGASFGQTYEAARTEIGGSWRAVQQLMSELSEALARFPS